MALIENSFHVNFPARGSIRFLDALEDKDAPIFIEALSDKFIVFHSHLGFPIEMEGKTISYMFDFVFLEETFSIRGKLVRRLSDGALKKYEGQFLLSEYERSKLFKLLNRYALILKQVSKGENTGKSSSYFSKHV